MADRTIRTDQLLDAQQEAGSSREKQHARETENVASDDQDQDRGDQTPEPGSAEDLLPDARPSDDPAKDIREKGEPGGGANFA